MEAVKDKRYGYMAARYQLLEIDRLNTVLRQRGIESKATRHQICYDYFFPNGLFLDADGDPFTWEGQRLHPIVAFAERVHEPGVGMKLKMIHVDDHANLYWSAEANLNRYFTELSEDISDIKKELGV